MRSSLHKTALIIPAAGSGERLGAKLPKALVQIAGRTLIEHAVTNLSPIANQIIIAAPAGAMEPEATVNGSPVMYAFPVGEETALVVNTPETVTCRPIFVYVPFAYAVVLIVPPLTIQVGVQVPVS